MTVWVSVLVFDSSSSDELPLSSDVDSCVWPCVGTCLTSCDSDAIVSSAIYDYVEVSGPVDCAGATAGGCSC